MAFSDILNRLMGSDTALCIFCEQRYPKHRMQLVHGDCGVCSSCRERLFKFAAQPLFLPVPGVDFLAAPFSYTDSAVQDAILRYKFRDCRSYAPVFAQCILVFLNRLEQENPGLFEKFDCIAPVPLSRERFFERGYNQSALLARLIAKKRKLPYDSELLLKRFHNQRQSSLPQPQRKANVSGVYTASARAAGKHILLIDDIVTTGSTLSECAVTLLNAGALSVGAAAIAHTERTVHSSAFFELMNPSKL